MSFDLTVIIPTWNRRDLLSSCLRSLQVQTVPCEVIVVDNGSRDGTSGMLLRDYPHVRLLQLEDNLGFSAAVNRGLEEVKTKYVALLNNDTEADPGWVEAGLTAFSTFPDYSFYASRMIDFRNRDLLDSAGDCYSRSGLPYKRGFGQPTTEYLEREEVLGASAGAAFYRTKIFDLIGFFDETFFLYLEDVDISLRAQLHGFRCLYLPNAIVYHIEAASDSARKSSAERTDRKFYSASRVYWITRNRWILMICYQPLRNLPWLVYGWSKSFLYHLIKAGHLFSFLRGLLGGLSRTPYALRKRFNLRRRKRVSNDELCRLMSLC